jgi:hypothetical protein
MGEIRYYPEALMALIAREATATDQLVYAWPFSIGAEPVEVSCRDDEVAVMCPAWSVGDRLGPGRHHWRSPDPAKPSNAYFVLTGPVEVAFDMTTQLVVPATQQPVRVRAQGSLLARCLDPAVLVSQFVGLPFDNLNQGVLRSVSSSVERLLARVLGRRVAGGGSAAAVTDPAMLPSIVDELTAYNPTAGAVIGVAFVRFNQLVIHADDAGLAGGAWAAGGGWGGGYPQPAYDPSFGQPYPSSGFAAGSNPPPVAAVPPAAPATSSNGSGSDVTSSSSSGVISGEIGGGRTTSIPPSAPDGTLPAGSRVLLPSPDGSLHASTIRQHSQGYYEVEIGATGQTVWVPVAQVIPEV